MIRRTARAKSERPLSPETKARIRRYVRDERMTQDEAALKAGVSQATVSRVLSREREL